MILSTKLPFVQYSYLNNCWDNRSEGNFATLTIQDGRGNHVLRGSDMNYV